MEAVHGSCGTDCNTRRCHYFLQNTSVLLFYIDVVLTLSISIGTKIKTWLLPCPWRLQMSIMYQCDAWAWMRIRVNVVLHGHLQKYLSVNMVKSYILPVLVMVNSIYYRQMGELWTLFSLHVHCISHVIWCWIWMVAYHGSYNVLRYFLFYDCMA